MNVARKIQYIRGFMYFCQYSMCSSQYLTYIARLDLADKDGVNAMSGKTIIFSLTWFVRKINIVFPNTLKTRKCKADTETCLKR